MQVKVRSDSSSARSIVASKRLGKWRHLETKFLWVRQCDERDDPHAPDICVENPADMLTKPLRKKDYERLLAKLGFTYAQDEDRRAIGDGSRETRRSEWGQGCCGAARRTEYDVCQDLGQIHIVVERAQMLSHLQQR